MKATALAVFTTRDTLMAQYPQCAVLPQWAALLLSFINSDHEMAQPCWHKPAWVAMASWCKFKESDLTYSSYSHDQTYCWNRTSGWKLAVSRVDDLRKVAEGLTGSAVRKTAQEHVAAFDMHQKAMLIC